MRISNEVEDLCRRFIESLEDLESWVNGITDDYEKAHILTKIEEIKDAYSKEENAEE